MRPTWRSPRASSSHASIDATGGWSATGVCSPPFPVPAARARISRRGAQALTTTRNEALFARAQRTIPAGVNSPVRAFGSVGGTPRFFTRGEGACLWDADGKRYIDYVGSWGPAILGHAHPDTARAVQETARHGLSFGAPTEL